MLFRSIASPTTNIEKLKSSISITSDKSSNVGSKGVKSIDELLKQKKETTPTPPATPTPTKEILPKTSLSKASKSSSVDKKERSTPSSQKPLLSTPQKTIEPEKPLVKPDTSSPPKLVKPGSTSQTLEKLAKPASIINEITTERIAAVLQPNEWVSLKDLINRLNISDMNDARYLQLKIKTMMRANQLNVKIDKGKQYWQLNK